MTTELVLLGTAGAPMPVVGRGGIFLRSWSTSGSLSSTAGGVHPPHSRRPVSTSPAWRPSSSRIFMSTMPAISPACSSIRGESASDEDGPLPPIRVYGPGAPDVAPAGDATFHRDTTVHPERPFPGTTDLVENILAGYAYHLNVMPLDCHMPDPGVLVRAIDISVPAPIAGDSGRPITVSKMRSSGSRLSP